MTPPGGHMQPPGMLPHRMMRHAMPPPGAMMFGMPPQMIPGAFVSSKDLYFILLGRKEFQIIIFVIILASNNFSQNY